MERGFGNTDKVLIDQNAQNSQGVVPFLPLNELQRRPTPQPQTGAAGGQGSIR
jgi:membrane protease subunit HflK